MNSAIQFVKAHAPILAGGLVGLLVLWYLFKNSGASAAAPATATDLSQGSSAVTSANTGNDLANAQANAGVEVAAYQAQVANTAVAGQVQIAALTTQAQLTATQQQTAASEAVAFGAQDTAVSIQKLQSDQAIAQTKIQGDTLEQLGATAGQTQVQLQQAKNVVQLAVVNNVKDQIALAEDPKKQGSVKEALLALAPILAVETGQGPSAVGIANANAPANVAQATGTARDIAAVGSVASGIGSILGGLFA